jgi:hypothetical protein
VVGTHFHPQYFLTDLDVLFNLSFPFT